MVDLMNKQKITIWGREFELDIVFDCYKGESVLPAQTDALDKFLKKEELINLAKSSVESYCIKRDSELIGATAIDNIFKYVIPESIYIQRAKDDKHIVGLMCKYKFDIDNGLAVVFENEKFKTVGTQDEIL
jgi:hypothetical protein